MLPPIEVNQHNILIDGWHRWTAHREARAETIAVVVTETRSDAHILELAITRNAQHGLQLSTRDKQQLAVQLYAGTPTGERDAMKGSLPGLLSVSERTVSRWLARTDKETKERQQEELYDLWLACHTQEEIATALGLSQPAVTEAMNFIRNGQMSISDKTLADFTDVPWHPYNVWKQQVRSEGAGHPGNTDASFVDRLVAGYTEPFGVVLDPFAGGGSTIDVCRKRSRRYLVSDLQPVVRREHEIRQHDITTGPLKPPQWKDVQLVYLDPALLAAAAIRRRAHRPVWHGRGRVPRCARLGDHGVRGEGSGRGGDRARHPTDAVEDTRPQGVC